MEKPEVVIMADNRCPLCKQPVSQELFEKITGIWRERRIQEKVLKEKQRDLIRQQKEAQKALEEEKRRLKTDQRAEIEKKVASQAKKYSSQLARLESQKNKIQQQSEKRIAAVVRSVERKARLEANQAMKAQLQESVKKAVEKASSRQTKDFLRTKRTLDSTREQMSTLQIQGLKQQEKIKNLEMQLKNQTTPQIEGLLYEDQLIQALKKEFSDDKFTHTGKGGDILQEVLIENRSCGLLIYECKRVANWKAAHAEQAYAAKIQRQADFAILVTNAPKKGSGGFFIEKGVIVVNPGGALAIAAILRDQIAKMAHLKLTHAQKEEAIEQTLKYLQGAEFKNSLDLVIKKTIEMYHDLKKECLDHIKAWNKRHDALKCVYLQTVQVQTKTTALISGKSKDGQGELANIQPFPALPNLMDLSG